MPVVVAGAVVGMLKVEIFGESKQCGGHTICLTTGADTLIGTNGSDTFEAGVSGVNKTLTAGDNLKGGNGTDTLNVSADAATNYAGFYLDGIEVVNAISDGVQNFDLSGATGLTTVKSSNSAAATAFNEVRNLVDLEVVNLTNTGGVSNVTVQYQAAAVAGTADAMKVTLNNSNAQTINIGNTNNAVAGVETINLVATGANSTVNQLNTNLTTLNFTGDKNVEITAALNNTVRTINATDATGGLTVSTNTANALTFTGGKGDDQVTFAAGTLTALDSVTGGDGNDRLVANQADLIASAAKVSQVEYIRVQDTLVNNVADAANVLDAGDFAGATRIELALGYNTARIDNLNASQQRVDILNNAVGGNVGVLTIDDGATSSVADQFTIALGQTKANNMVNATVGFVSGEIETVNLISNGTTVAGGNTININAGTGNLHTLNISGTEDLTVTTAGSVVTTIAAGDATGDLNLNGVALSAAASATITTGSGDDQVTGGVKADTINVGAGDDVVIGSAGADTITLGDGIDTVVYTSLAQSSSAATDTITDFASGTDLIDISGLGATAYAGTKASFDLAQGALTGGGVVSAVYDAAGQRLWVDLDGNGTLDGNDFRVVMNGVSTLATASVTTGGGNAFTVTAGVANPGNAFNNTFTALAADLTGTTRIDGVSGTDTLVISDDANTVDLSVGPIVSNIDRVTLAAGSTGAFTAHNEADVIVTASAAATVVLGTGDNQTFNGSGAADTVTLGAANQNVSAGAGNDTIIATAATLLLSNIDGGAGTDTLQVASGGDISATTGAWTGVERLQLDTGAGSKTLTLSVAQYNGFTGGVIDQDAGANDVITFSGAGTATVNAATTVQLYNFAAAGNTLDIGAVAGKFAVTGGAGDDRVNINSSVWDANDTFDGATGTDTFAVTVDADVTLTAGNVKADNVENFIIAGTAATATTGVNLTFQEAANTLLTSVDLSGLTNGGTINMGSLATAAQTINARNGAADVIDGSTVTTGVTTTVSLDHGDTFDNNAVAAGTSDTVVQAFGRDNGTTNITVATSVDFDATDLILSFFKADGTQVNVQNIGAWAAGNVNATATLSGGTDTVIAVDMDANGLLGNGDITITVVGQDLTGGGLGLDSGSITF